MRGVIIIICIQISKTEIFSLVLNSSCKNGVADLFFFQGGLVVGGLGGLASLAVGARKQRSRTRRNGTRNKRRGNRKQSRCSCAMSGFRSRQAAITMARENFLKQFLFRDSAARRRTTNNRTNYKTEDRVLWQKTKTHWQRSWSQ